MRFNFETKKCGNSLSFRKNENGTQGRLRERGLPTLFRTKKKMIGASPIEPKNAGTPAIFKKGSNGTQRSSLKVGTPSFLSEKYRFRNSENNVRARKCGNSRVQFRIEIF
ncbi:hypothetical protein DLM75_05805 [Leptospira stimsonii]|uniref:Uncharacterized protein n=1 Tax=Leptospira stimsonii TaxID=2202203 RepID=A0A396ZGT2_9LEPT|nr:hypothetical protein DLM75_05805 [Leptospira stimsonii]